MVSREPSPNLRPSAVSVSTSAQVTSAPVPAVVGIVIRRALAPRPSATIGLISSTCKSGRSYSTHIALAASMAEPPPNPTIQSGSNARMASAPR